MVKCYTKKRKNGSNYTTCNKNIPENRRNARLKPKPIKIPKIKRGIIKARPLNLKARVGLGYKPNQLAENKRLALARRPTPGFAQGIVMNNPMFRNQIFRNLSKNPMMDAMGGLSKGQKKSRLKKLANLKKPFQYIKGGRGGYGDKVIRKNPKDQRNDVLTMKRCIKAEGIARAKSKLDKRYRYTAQRPHFYYKPEGARNEQPDFSFND